MSARGRPSRQAVLLRFQTAITELQRFGGLPRTGESRQIWDDIWHLEAHNSTAIEGNTLVLREVATLLDEGRAVGAKALKDYMEVLGYGAAARWVYARALDPGEWVTGDLISLTELRHIHRAAMSNVWEIAPHPDAAPEETPGNLRRHDIQPFDGGMQPPSWTDVPPLITDWVAEVAAFGAGVGPDSGAQSDIPMGIANLHVHFERIHPFIDGNGRAGRLALNLILVRLGFPPAIIFKRQRAAYLDALGRADNGDAGALAELFARSIIDNLHRFVVPHIAGPAGLVPLPSLATAEVSYEALRQAARRGRLDAEQGSDGIWRSTRTAIDAYVQRRYQRASAPT